MAEGVRALPRDNLTGCCPHPLLREPQISLSTGKGSAERKEGERAKRKQMGKFSCLLRSHCNMPRKLSLMNHSSSWQRPKCTLVVARGADKTSGLLVASHVFTGVSHGHLCTSVLRTHLDSRAHTQSVNSNTGKGSPHSLAAK